MRGLLAALLTLTACSRHEAPALPDRVDAPPPRDSATSEPPLTKLMVGARVVDITARAVAHELQKSPPTFAEVDEKWAFVVHEGIVRAFDSHTAGERWHVTPAACRHFAMTSRAVYCAGDTEIHVLGKADGALTTIAGTAPIAQLFGLGRHLIVLRAGGTLESYAEGTTTPVAAVSASLHAYRPFVANGDGFCAAAASVKGGVFAGCWSATLKPRWTRAIAIAKPGDPTLTGYDVRRLGHGFLVAGTLPWAKSVNRSVVVRLADGDELARVDEDVAAVASSSERTIDGLISLRKGLRYLEPSGAVRWTAPTLHVDDSADALLDGDRLFVATYPMISSGSTLYGLDRKTGVLHFTHAPPMPPIAHSAYINDVQLSFVSNTLVMRGHEAAVEYASLLDPATGTAHITTLLPLWP